MKAAGERNIRIPRDLSLIGFDNIPSSGYPRIELTTVEQPKKAMAVEAVRILIEKIESDESGENGYTHQILIPKLIKRSTCREIDLTE